MVASAAILAVLVSIAGCAPAAQPDPPQPSSTSPTIPVEPTEPIADEPEPRFDLECDDIAALVDFSAFPVPITIQDPFSTSASQGQYSYAPEYITKVRTYGGLRCEWTDGLPEYFPSAQDRQYPDSLLEVTILPDAREFANSLQYPPRDSLLEECVEDSYQHLCTFQKLVDDYWIEITTTGAHALDSQKIISAVESQVSALGVAAPPWSPVVPAMVLTPDCDTVLDHSTVIGRYLGGVETMPWFGSAVGHFGLELTNAKLGEWNCVYSSNSEQVNNGDLLGVAVSVLPRAGWAVMPYSQNTAHPYPVTEIVVDGTQSGDVAFKTCRSSSDSPEFLSCVVNLSFAGNWLSISVAGGSRTEQAATEIASLVVERLS